MGISHAKISLEHLVPTAVSHFIISHLGHKTVTHQRCNFFSVEYIPSVIGFHIYLTHF